MNAPQPDPFAALLGARRGVADASPWPRYAPPPPSSAPPVRSLADFRRRLRPGVVGVLDVLDGLGQVVERSRCVVHRGPGYRTPWWSVQGFDEGQQCRWSSGENFPRRASDCRFEGASLRYGGWRFTFLDERAAQADASEPERLAPLPSEAWRAVEAELQRCTKFRGTPYMRGLRSVGNPLCGWTTRSDAHGYFWSFVCHPEAAAGKPGRDVSRVVVRVKDHRLRREAKTRAESVFQAALNGAVLD